MWEDILSMKIAKDMQCYTIHLTSKQAGSIEDTEILVKQDTSIWQKKKEEEDIFKPTKIKMK